MEQALDLRISPDLIMGHMMDMVELHLIFWPKQLQRRKCHGVQFGDRFLHNPKNYAKQYKIKDVRWRAEE